MNRNGVCRTSPARPGLLLKKNKLNKKVTDCVILELNIMNKMGGFRYMVEDQCPDEIF